MTGWDGQKRSDGLVVVAKDPDSYVIMPKVGKPVDTCPCCGAYLATVKQAKLVADAFLPFHHGRPASQREARL